MSKVGQAGDSDLDISYDMDTADIATQLQI